MNDSASLISINITFLEQGTALLERISDEEYVFTDPPLFNSGIGKHMRHILDHYESLVNGWNVKIDYDSRKRGTDVEDFTERAVAKSNSIIHALREYEKSGQPIDQKVLVRSNEGGESCGTPWSSSSVKRELQFMVSHTVHHYALIAFILRSQGIEVSSDFGVAPSTLRYEKQKLVKQ